MGLKKHYQSVRRVLLLTLVLNWAVALAKVIYGKFTHCESMAADGIHSLADGASNIIGLIGIHFAYQPKDTKHPYGHKKYETLFSLAIAGLLFLLSFNLIKGSIGKIFNPIIPQVDIGSFIVMLITLTVNCWVMNYERKKGEALGSDILISDSLHTKADILISASVIITLIVIKLGFPILDPIATIIISLFIAHAGYQIAKKAQAVLCDTAAIVDVSKVMNTVMGVRGVKNCHKIRSRGRPDDIHLDLHVQVDPEMHIDDAHKISYEIEKAIKKEFPQITDVVVHLEPKEKPKTP
ncbi:MAG: cation diffusion facilitator family transporter [Candidatus Omnitrophica bacterium]|nr:cation diffusion facilitator family transporter [Candidatus Omnitrophota bacterium]